MGDGILGYDLWIDKEEEIIIRHLIRSIKYMSSKYSCTIYDFIKNCVLPMSEKEVITCDKCKKDIVSKMVPVTRNNNVNFYCYECYDTIKNLKE